MLTKLRALVPARYREIGYRVSNTLTIVLLVGGYVTSTEAALWSGLVTGVITLVFALLHATSTWRAAIYVFTGPLGSVLLAYGVVDDVKWAFIVSAAGYALGITTAAAKAQTVIRLPR